jgi:serine/threonine-protein kinase
VKICPGCHTENADDTVACAACATALGAILSQGAVVANRYEIGKPLGKGGMGTVYRAHDKVLDETVALKVLRAELAQDPDLARRFRSEIKLARRIRHRNVCGIHEYGEQADLRYIAMELIEGVDLKQVLRTRGALPAREAFDVSIQAAEGLQAIHDAGVIHRDLKTTNIMVDAKGLVRLMDFGVAKQLGGGATLSGTSMGMIVGTPEYMSPEQARGETLDGRSDVYALGVVVFEIFTGHVPFEGDTPIATIFKHLQEAPPLEGPRAAGIPSEALPVLRKALAKDPVERLPSAHAMAEAMRAARVQHFSGMAAGTPTPKPQPTVLVPPPGPAPPAPAMPPTQVQPTPVPKGTAAARPPDSPTPGTPPSATKPPARPTGASRLTTPTSQAAVHAKLEELRSLAGGATKAAGSKDRATPTPVPLPPPKPPMAPEPAVGAGVGRSGPAPASPGPPLVPVEAKPAGPTADASGLEATVVVTRPSAAIQAIVRPEPAPPAEPEPEDFYEDLSSPPRRRLPVLPLAGAGLALVAAVFLMLGRLRRAPESPPPAPPSPAAEASAVAAAPPASAVPSPATPPASQRPGGPVARPSTAATPRARASALPVPDLTAGVRTGDAPERLAAVAAARQAGTAGLAALTIAAKDKDRTVRLSAIDGLGELGPAASPAAVVLGEALRDSDGRVRVAAASALAGVGPGASPALPRLADVLKNGDRSLQTVAALALARMGEAGLPVLTGALRDKDHDVHDAATRGLIALGTPAVAIFVAALQDADSHQRRNAVTALGALGPRAQDAVAALRMSASGDADKDVRALALDALRKIEVPRGR